MKEVDILILAEGTYPYIKGGVSEWLHVLISNLPEYNFGVIFLGGQKDMYTEYAYELPENVKFVEEYFLFEKISKPEIKKTDFSERTYETVKTLHRWFKTYKNFPWEAKRLDFYLEKVKEEDFLYGYKSWKFIEEKYMENCPDHPFIDYFWNVRNMHAPIWRVAEAARTEIKPKLLHSPSTGYAGFLGSLMKLDREIPLIIHEHGIYTRERKIDLMNVEWLQDKRSIFQKSITDTYYIKELWINFFVSLGKFQYDTADRIFSLFEDARKIQIDYGADPKKTEVIPNGIDVSKFIHLRRFDIKEIPKRIALVGRVVPIKDIKTFIKAIKILKESIPDVEGWIVGPEDEDPEYAQECRDLVVALNIEENIKFLGYRETTQILSEVGLITLTSISEGMPLIVLEAFAAGIPVVATDVGACRQLIYGGLSEEDEKIGKAGEIAPVGRPEILAKHYRSFLTDVNLWKKAQQAAITRVEKFYTLEEFLKRYKKVFRSML